MQSFVSLKRQNMPIEWNRADRAISAASNSAYSGYPELWIWRYPAHRYRAVHSPRTLCWESWRPNHSATTEGFNIPSCALHLHDVRAATWRTSCTQILRDMCARFTHRMHDAGCARHTHESDANGAHTCRAQQGMLLLDPSVEHSNNYQPQAGNHKQKNRMVENRAADHQARSVRGR
jgi:hypothetical protein